jgi:hypothetical protein
MIGKKHALICLDWTDSFHLAKRIHLVYMEKKTSF